MLRPRHVAGPLKKQIVMCNTLKSKNSWHRCGVKGHRIVWAPPRQSEGREHQMRTKEDQPLGDPKKIRTKTRTKGTNETRNC